VLVTRALPTQSNTEKKHRPPCFEWDSIPVYERVKTVHASRRVATEICSSVRRFGKSNFSLSQIVGRQVDLRHVFTAVEDQPTARQNGNGALMHPFPPALIIMR
jgi:hypothetical protein